MRFFIFSTSHIKKLRINTQIKANQVMLVDDESQAQLGIKFLDEALALAKMKSLDLVEVSPLTKPPVCKLMDYGQYLYKQKKIEQKHKQSHKKKSLKNIRLSVRIDQHDLEIKAKNARKFLETGNPVKVTLQFRGREMQHAELGFEKINSFIEMVGDLVKVDQVPRKQGYQIFVLLTPHLTQKTK